MTRPEIIAALKALVRRLDDQARYDRAGAAVFEAEFNENKTARPATMKAHERLLELFPLAIGGKQQAEENEQNISLIMEVIRILEGEEQT